MTQWRTNGRPADLCNADGGGAKPQKAIDDELVRQTSHRRKHFLIVHNPIAGMRRRWLLHEVCRHLHDAGAHYDLLSAASLDEDRRIARQAVADGRYEAVVAAGGDSTVRGVAGGLTGSMVPLGIIPIGTGNVLAHEIGMRKGPRTIASYLMEGRSIPMRAGLANGEPFGLMASAGFDARVLSRLETLWKRRMGKLAYIWPVLRELAADQPLFEVTMDGEHQQCAWLIVTKVRHYGGPFIVAPHQHLQSDHFHAVTITATNSRDLVRAMSSVAIGRGRHNPHVQLRPCRHVVVQGGDEITTQLDGEAFGSLPLDITMSEDSFQILVPERFQGLSPGGLASGNAVEDESARSLTAKA